MYNCYKYYYQIGPCWFGSDYSFLFAKQTKYSWFLSKGTQLSSKKPCPSRIAKSKLHPRVNSGKSGQLWHIYPSAQKIIGLTLAAVGLCTTVHGPSASNITPANTHYWMATASLTGSRQTLPKPTFHKKAHNFRVYIHPINVTDPRDSTRQDWNEGAINTAVQNWQFAKNSW